jgi:hypothetical protein
MKTTVNIPDPLFKQVKRLAAQRNSNLKTIINESLRLYIERSRAADESDIEFHTADGNGLQNGLSWDDWSAVRDLIYTGRGTTP